MVKGKFLPSPAFVPTSVDWKLGLVQKQIPKAATIKVDLLTDVADFKAVIKTVVMKIERYAAD